MENTRKWNEILRYERELHHWSQQKVARALGTDAKKISEWELGKTKPSYKYRAKICKLFGKSSTEFGFIGQEFNNEALDDDSQEEDIEATDSPQDAVQNTDNDDPSRCQVTQIYGPHGVVTVCQQTSNRTATPFPPPTIQVVTPSIFASLNELDPLYSDVGTAPQNSVYFRQVTSHPVSTRGLGNTVNRREFGRRMLRFGSAAFLAYQAELLERFTRALKNPSTIDEKMLNYIERRTENSWYDRHTVALPSHDLFDYVSEDFENVTDLLEGPMLPTVRTRLCSIAGGIALLAGELLYDMRYYAQAREYYIVSIKAAQEANNEALQAVTWGRMSFTWTYEGNPQSALMCIQEARRLGARSVNATIRAWLAAVEAEIQANLHERSASLNALDGTENVEDQMRPQDCYWIHFDRSLSAGYRGVSLLRLYYPGDPQTASFLVDAQHALTDALDLLNPALMRRRPNLLADLAGTYVRQKNVEAACEHAIEAVTLASQIKSKVVLQRLVSLRHELDPWKYTEYVQHLDAQMTPLLKAGWYRGNG